MSYKWFGANQFFSFFMVLSFCRLVLKMEWKKPKNVGLQMTIYKLIGRRIAKIEGINRTQHIAAIGILDCQYDHTNHMNNSNYNYYIKPKQNKWKRKEKHWKWLQRKIRHKYGQTEIFSLFLSFTLPFRNGNAVMAHSPERLWMIDRFSDVEVNIEHLCNTRQSMCALFFSPSSSFLSSHDRMATFGVFHRPAPINFESHTI